MRNRQMQKGFTLIELLVVIAVVLILASILVVGLGAVLRETKKDEAQITVNNLSTGVTRMKADTNLYGKPLALYIDSATIVNRDKPTIVELQARAPKLNLALELCPKRIYPELVYQSPAVDKWPFVNVRKRNRDLPTNDAKSYDFASYFEPNGRQILKIGATVTQIVDPWLQPYKYLVFEEITNVMQKDNVTLVAKSIFIEVIASAGPDLTMATGMTNFNTAGGFVDFASFPENEDNVYVEIGRWSPKVN